MFGTGDGKSTSMWFDKWNESGTIDEIIPFKKRYEASFDEKENVDDLIVHMLADMKADKVMWIGVNGKKRKVFYKECLGDLQRRTERCELAQGYMVSPMQSKACFHHVVGYA
ncbi:hypothetical protein Tco_0807275 [Tanacetum coccineum]